MLTQKQLKQCLPLPGAYPMNLLKVYFELVLDIELSDDDMYQIMDYWKKRYLEAHAE